MKQKRILSPFGKLMRQIRIDNDETMCAMATKLGTNSSYLCSIEHGKYSVPDDWIDGLVKKYNLNQSYRDRLLSAASKQQIMSKIHLSHCDEDVRQFVLRLSDSLNRSCSVTKKRLDKILSELND